VILLPAGNPSLWTGPTGTNTYLLPGRVSTLIDAGVGAASHIAALSERLGARPLDSVLVTHGHSDHAAGVPALTERWPSARVRPDAAAFADGESIEAGDDTLKALFTPGHAPDHFSFFDEARREIYCGDLLRIGGTIVIPASRGGDLRAYLASLCRIRDLHPRRLLPGHGPAIEDPEQLIAEYLAHRQERERQIVDALRRGRSTPAEIVPDVYGKLASVLAAGAGDSILAHLRKLEHEGVAAVVDDRWRLL
jgi:glyoxylase-like metal-dependent hydrolase (beta-lactamase superfamily II)